MPQPKQLPKTKLEKFLAALNDLAKDWQYEIKPIISYTKEGILPVLSVTDVPPKRTEKVKKTKKK